MSSQARKLLIDALSLPVSDRAELAAHLIESIDEQPDHNAEAAWDMEIARRLQELDSGSVQTIPWDQARRMILERSDSPTSD